MFGTIGVFAVLISGSFYDIRKKVIPFWILAAGCVGGVVRCIILAGETGILPALQNVLGGILPGAGLLLLGYLTEKKIGFGDGIVLGIMGILEGGKTAFLTFCIGLFLQSLFAVSLLILKRADKQTQIPFLPFLLGARILLLVYQGG